MAGPTAAARQRRGPAAHPTHEPGAELEGSHPRRAEPIASPPRSEHARRSERSAGGLRPGGTRDHAAGSADLHLRHWHDRGGGVGDGSGLHGAGGARAVAAAGQVDPPVRGWALEPVAGVRIRRGGLASIAADSLAFASALRASGAHRGGRVLPRPAVTLMTSDQLTSGAEGAVWVLAGVPRGHRLGFRHGGPHPAHAPRTLGRELRMVRLLRHCLVQRPRRGNDDMQRAHAGDPGCRCGSTSGPPSTRRSRTDCGARDRWAGAAVSAGATSEAAYSCSDQAASADSPMPTASSRRGGSAGRARRPGG
jgi:hypothetical protein